MTRLNNLERLEQEADRAGKHKEAFENYFIGALSICVDQEIWDRCLGSAGEILTRYEGTWVVSESPISKAEGK